MKEIYAQSCPRKIFHESQLTPRLTDPTFHLTSMLGHHFWSPNTDISNVGRNLLGIKTFWRRQPTILLFQIFGWNFGSFEYLFIYQSNICEIVGWNVGWNTGSSKRALRPKFDGLGIPGIFCWGFPTPEVPGHCAVCRMTSKTDVILQQIGLFVLCALHLIFNAI